MEHEGLLRLEALKRSAEAENAEREARAATASAELELESLRTQVMHRNMYSTWCRTRLPEGFPSQLMGGGFSIQLAEDFLLAALSHVFRFRC